MYYVLCSCFPMSLNFGSLQGTAKHQHYSLVPFSKTQGTAKIRGDCSPPRNHIEDISRLWLNVCIVD
ncbi:hypothetical protein V6Z11_D12G053800 [Gossypium hirsutum]